MKTPGRYRCSLIGKARSNLEGYYKHEVGLVEYPRRVRFAHILEGSSDSPSLAVVKDERVLLLRELGFDFDTLQSLIEAGPEALAKVRDSVANASTATAPPVGDVSLAPAVINPPITLAVGLNYDEHASELSLDNDAGPVLFTLFPNSLAGHEAQVPIREDISVEIDYEAELGVIIGKPAKDVSPEEALDYVFGYTAINDITARDIQFREPQWSRCKSFDGFTPVGPVVVTADEIPDPQVLDITCDVDDLRVQDSNTSYMIRTVAQLISTISEGATLQPGTLISTGSPGGAGRSRRPPLYLKPGTTVSVEIEKIGKITSFCVDGAEA